jgi:hypothetical protein
LLDWRLGLDVIQLLLDQTYNAGLNGDFTSPGVADWSENALRLAKEAASLYSDSAARNEGEYTRDSHRAGRWAAVLHPFWDPDAAFAANPELEAFSYEVDVDATNTLHYPAAWGLKWQNYGLRRPRLRSDNAMNEMTLSRTRPVLPSLLGSFVICPAKYLLESEAHSYARLPLHRE